MIAFVHLWEYLAHSYF